MLSAFEMIELMRSKESRGFNSFINIVNMSTKNIDNKINFITEIAQTVCNEYLGLSYRDIIVVDEFYDEDGFVIEDPVMGMFVYDANYEGVDYVMPVLINSECLNDFEQCVKTIAHELRHVFQFIKLNELECEGVQGLRPFDEDLDYFDQWIELDAYLFEEEVYEIFCKKLAV